MTKKQEHSLGKLEETLADLEQLVERLEAGDLPLNQALAEFERGIKLTRQCQSVLKEAEQKIEILLAEADEPEAFEAEAD
jgi:exodeoxyribonuclease VII small subunit